MTIAQTLRNAATNLRRTSPTPYLDAEVLLAYVLGTSRERLAMQPEVVIAAHPGRRFAALLRRRLRKEPVAHLRGMQEFFGLPLAVNRHVLIPRPESEAIVEAVLAATQPREHLTIADIGTGSGCLAVAIAKHRPRARMLATDRSAPALRVAKRNAHDLQVRIVFRQGDLLAPLGRTEVDILVANLPYLPARTYHNRRAHLTWEPRSALVAGPDGFRYYRQLFTGMAQLTHLPKLVIVELEIGQLPLLRRTLRTHRLPYTLQVRRSNGIAIASLIKNHPLGMV